MADNADLAAQEEERFLQESFHRREQERLRIKPNGRCLNCWEPLDPGVSFCDPDCHDDWSARNRR